MIDIVNEINAVHREVGKGTFDAGEGPTVVMRRRYDAAVADVWDACTNPERIPRWFLPVTGDFRLGGRYQLEGQAGGEIRRCDPPHLLRLTWVFGELPPSEVELRLSPGADPDTTDFELEHVAIVDPTMWAEFGPGAVGIGWDMILLGLRLYLSTGETVGNAMEWQMSDEGKEFVTRSSQAWSAAHEASGEDPATAAAMAQRTTAAYTATPEN